MPRRASDASSSVEGARLDMMVETSQRTKVSWEGSQAASASNSSTRKDSFHKLAMAASASARTTPRKGEHATRTNVSELSETHQSFVATLVKQFPAFTQGLPPLLHCSLHHQAARRSPTSACVVTNRSDSNQGR
jgi:hypothetical protein